MQVFLWSLLGILFAIFFRELPQYHYKFGHTLFWWISQDGEIWTFSVRSFEAPLPELTVHVNYEGFAEG